MFPFPFPKITINTTTILAGSVVALVIALFISWYMISNRNDTIKGLTKDLKTKEAEAMVLQLQADALVQTVEDQNKHIESISVDYARSLKNRKTITKEVLKVVYRDRNITIPAKECTELANHIDSIKEMGL
jgi:hypothetical protein